MADIKTTQTDSDVRAFLDSVDPAQRRADGIALDALFQKTTGMAPRLWGPSIVGYGRYDYTYDSGHSGSMCATGFSPRKANLVVYVLPGYTDFSEILGRLGKHKKGKSCLYLNKLADVDTEVLAELIRAGLTDLAKHWPVHPQ